MTTIAYRAGQMAADSGAMAAGACAARAVEIACALDCATNGPVISLTRRPA